MSCRKFWLAYRITLYCFISRNQFLFHFIKYDFIFTSRNTIFRYDAKIIIYFPSSEKRGRALKLVNVFHSDIAYTISSQEPLKQWLGRTLSPLLILASERECRFSFRTDEPVMATICPIYSWTSCSRQSWESPARVIRSQLLFLAGAGNRRILGLLPGGLSSARCLTR